MASQSQTIKPTLNQADLKLIAAVVAEIFDQKFSKAFDEAFDRKFPKAFNKAFNEAFPKAFDEALNYDYFKDNTKTFESSCDIIRQLSRRTKLLLAHK